MEVIPNRILRGTPIRIRISELYESNKRIFIGLLVPEGCQKIRLDHIDSGLGFDQEGFLVAGQ